MRRLLVLRPEPGATATLVRARELGLDAIGLPLFAIEPVPWTAPDPDEFDGLLLTSANAVRQGGEALRKLLRLPVYAVGAATAEAAREAGFQIAAEGDAGLEGLLGSIAPDVKLLHLCGERRTSPREAQRQITPVVVYRSNELPDAELGDCADCVALVHSPRAGGRLAELARERSGIAVAAISAAAAQAVGSGWDEVAAAETPTDDALLALAARLCNKSATK